MASKFITEPMQKVQQAVMPGNHGDKILDLQRDTREDNGKARMTTDFGVRQGNAEDWLKVVSEDKTGPMLLEDVFGRERVCDSSHLTSSVAPC